MRKVFVSYYHKDDQIYKDGLVKWSEQNKVFIDGSVDTGDIDEYLPAERIYQIIRDEYLRDTSVTIVLLGLNTKKRKHVDREIGSSLRDTGKNPRSGLVIILLPEFVRSFGTNITQQNSGERIYDNVKNGYAVVIEWDKSSSQNLKSLIDKAYSNKAIINPDNSAPFRTRNSE
ncbi:hypothetical protein SHELI_v1c04270 [Spiroplasma helicoides]|uniref:Thoeris protein ThsB TIR-like domain-containing protein n=1 Tax=Spiroplasma helicoides TaxID=216938 RepID=A0A1B3SKC6_9MOLU|nr:TIR domain-containing protein [Spiroplasma helicoides]AOG60378.1 hypothetical protein SHELI_v1c04270 [Spiroplasma helicoides]